MVEVKLGAATATRIEESYEPNFEAPKFFSDWNPEVVNEHRDWLVSNHYDAGSNFLKLSIHSWLLKVGGKTILIDTCVGNHKSRKHRPKWDMMNTPYLARLKAAGVTPDQIDMVMCTHLHVDHVGWNTQLENGRWVPTFKNAKYVWSQEDFDFYSKLDKDPEKGPANGGSFRDSVLPVVEAGMAQMVKGGSQLDENLRITPAPGHTPGTIRIEFESQGREGAVLRRHPAPRRAGLSSRMEQLRLPRPGQCAQVAARGDRALRRLGRAADALPFRRAVHLPHRPQGRRLRATLQRQLLEGENR